jgi:hypothetical protein
MKQSLAVLFIGVAFLGAVGCGSDKDSEKLSGQVSESGDENLLADLLTQPRKELAAQAQDWEARVRKHESSLRLDAASFALLPELRFPLKIPVWQEASFSEPLGISIPTKASVGQGSFAMAEHLALFGDLDAAKKLAGADSKIPNSSHVDRNYPLEWSRLVALMQFDAQYRLAMGDTEGAKELISLHGKLLKVLDDKAKKGPLGADLLGRGRTTLAAAALALKKGRDPELAQAIDSALASWGSVPTPLDFVSLDLPAEQSKKQTGSGQAVIFAGPLPTLDLMGLPVISEGCQAVVVFLDKSGKTTEVLATYRPKLIDIVTDAGQLTPTLHDADLGQSIGGGSNRLQRSFQAGNLNCEARLFPQGSALGGMVRLVPANGSSAKSSLASGQTPVVRDFGIVHLDRSFEQNRLQVAPEQQGDSVQTKRTQILNKIKNALDHWTPSLVTIQREKGQEAVSKLILRYERDKEGALLHQLVASLWQKMGPAQIEESHDAESSYLTLTWQDSKTHMTLIVPNSENLPIELVVENQGAKNLEGAQVVATLDEVERKARIEAGKPSLRLPRQLEGVEIGQSKGQALATLLEGAKALKKDFPGGFSVVYPRASTKDTKSVLRQVLVRCDAKDKVAEVSCRYQRGPGANAATWSSDQLKAWKKLGGAPAGSESPSASLWSELDPHAASLKSYKWRDDLTQLSFTVDGPTADVTLLDCPLDEPKGVALGELSFLTLGPEDCALTTSRETLLKNWQATKPGKAPKVDLVLYPSAKSPYDVLLVWFESDRVARVVARFRSAASKERPSPGQLLSDAWGQSMQTWGWPSHHDFGTNQELTSMGAHDDKVRFRIYSQLSDDGAPRVFAEWKKIGSPTQVSATRR